MRIAIPGGSGLIGRHLAVHLADAGHTCAVLSRDTQSLSLPGIEVLPWDPHDPGRLTQTLAGFEAVVNLCGEGIADGRWTADRKNSLRESRIIPGQTLAQAITNMPVKPAVFIQASGIGYYDQDPAASPDESSPPGTGFLAELAVDWEASTQPVEALGVRRAVIRTGIVLARDGGALPVMTRPFRYYLGGPLGSGRQWLNWIHIRDEVRAICFLIEHPSAAGPFNLCAPTPVTQAEFAVALGRHLHHPSLLRLPAAAMKILTGEMSDMVLKGSRARPLRLMELGFTYTYAVIVKALADLV